MSVLRVHHVSPVSGTALLTAAFLVGCATPAVSEPTEPRMASSVTTTETAIIERSSTSTPAPEPPVARIEVAPTDEADRALASVQISRRVIMDGGDRRSVVNSEKRRAAVAACFAEIPLEERSRTHVHEVTLRWTNSSYRGSDGLGLGPGLGATGSGYGQYPPRVQHDGFTACVTAAIPKERTSSMDRDHERIRAIEVTVLVYTEAAADEYLVGEVFHGGGAARGFGRARRPRRR